MHSLVQRLPLSASRAFSSSQTATPHPLNSNSPFPTLCSPWKLLFYFLFEPLFGYLLDRKKKESLLIYERIGRHDQAPSVRQTVTQGRLSSDPGFLLMLLSQCPSAQKAGLPVLPPVCLRPRQECFIHTHGSSASSPSSGSLSTVTEASISTDRRMG